MAIAIIVLCVAVVFWMGQFYDLMRRRDDEFPGHFDKPIWAGVMLFGSVFGAFVYWFSKQSPAPASSELLRREYAAAASQRAMGSTGPANAG